MFKSLESFKESNKKHKKAETQRSKYFYFAYLADSTNRFEDLQYFMREVCNVRKCLILNVIGL